MKTLHKIIGIGALILGLSGCTREYSPLKGVFEDYPVEYSKNLFGLQFVYVYSKEKSGGEIVFRDGGGSPIDGRLDYMELRDIKKGDPIEKFASLEVGQKILNFLIDKK